MESAVDRKEQVQDLAQTNINKNAESQSRLTAPQLRQLAIKYQQQGKTEQAIGLYQAFLKFHPTDIAIWCNLGAALRKQKHYQSAVNCYRRALEIQPNDLTASGNLANALKDLHRLDEAIAIHQHVVAQ